MKDFLVGSDPEGFLHDGLEYISAFGLFPGTKKEPHKLNKGAVQVDGMALEYNIDPASSPEEFSENHETVLSQIKDMVKEVNSNFNLVFEPFAEFDETYFVIQPWECKVLGCDPDYSPIGKMKIPDGNLQHSPFRTAAGHVHIGWTSNENPMNEKHFELCKRVAQAFLKADGFFPTTKSEKQRVRYYGQPGSFRPKSYGVELRSPSNLWVKNRESRMKMFNTVQEVMEKI